MLSNEDILSIVKMRMAVYAAGTETGAWKDIGASGASDMMAYLFPKSGRLAYFQLVMEQMRAHHDMFTGGVFYLFKMPVQVEKEILEFLRNEEIDINSFKDNAKEYLVEVDTIPTDHTLSIVNIGTFSLPNVSLLLRLCAAHYRYAFDNHIQSYPWLPHMDNSPFSVHHSQF